MDISKIEKWSPSSNVYDDLRAVDSLSGPKIPARSTSTISYISPRELENSQAKRSTVSLILPVPIASGEQKTTILSMDDTKRSSPVELIEEDVQSCIYLAVRLLVQLICIALLACFIGIFVFTLIFYAFDNYWLEQPFTNHSFWYDDTNFTEFDYDDQY